MGKLMGIDVRNKTQSELYVAATQGVALGQVLVAPSGRALLMTREVLMGKLMGIDGN